MAPNAAAYLLTRSNRFQHATPLLRLLLFPFIFHAQFMVLVLTYKALFSLVPRYVETVFPYIVLYRHCGQQAGGCLLRVLSIIDVCLWGIGDRAFSGPLQLWNTLPKVVFHGIFLSHFRQSIKTELLGGPTIWFLGIIMAWLFCGYFIVLWSLILLIKSLWAQLWPYKSGMH